MIIDYAMICVGGLIGCPIGLLFAVLFDKMFEKITKNNKI